MIIWLVTVLMSRVAAVVPNDDPRWSYAHLSWTGQPPAAGTTGQYRIVAHLDTTRRIMVAPAG